MSKTKKVLLAVGLSLIGLIFVAIGVLYINFPQETKNFVMTAWDWLNRPLPVVGFSTLFIIVFLWRVFAGSSFGKKQINKFEKESEETKKQFDALKEEYEKRIQDYRDLLMQYENELNTTKNYVKSICDNSRNVKIKKIGANINVCQREESEETTNNETETN